MNGPEKNPKVEVTRGIIRRSSERKSDILVTVDGRDYHVYTRSLLDFLGYTTDMAMKEVCLQEECRSKIKALMGQVVRVHTYPELGLARIISDVPKDLPSGDGAIAALVREFTIFEWTMPRK